LESGPVEGSISTTLPPVNGYGYSKMGNLGAGGRRAGKPAGMGGRGPENLGKPESPEVSGGWEPESRDTWGEAGGPGSQRGQEAGEPGHLGKPEGPEVSGGREPESRDTWRKPDGPEVSGGRRPESRETWGEAGGSGSKRGQEAGEPGNLGGDRRFRKSAWAGGRRAGKPGGVRSSRKSAGAGGWRSGKHAGLAVRRSLTGRDLLKLVTDPRRKGRTVGRQMACFFWGKGTGQAVRTDLRHLLRGLETHRS
jgi:hypothetical protein